MNGQLNTLIHRKKAFSKFQSEGENRLKMQFDETELLKGIPGKLSAVVFELVNIFSPVSINYKPLWSSLWVVPLAHSWPSCIIKAKPKILKSQKKHSFLLHTFRVYLGALRVVFRVNFFISFWDLIIYCFDNSLLSEVLPDSLGGLLTCFDSSVYRSWIFNAVNPKLK